MNKARDTRDTRAARAAIRGFNAARGKAYAKGDESDLADLLTALMVLTAGRPQLYGCFADQVGRAQRNYHAEGGL